MIDSKQKTNQWISTLDDDIYRFSELLDMIDRPVNTGNTWQHQPSL